MYYLTFRCLCNIIVCFNKIVQVYKFVDYFGFFFFFPYDKQCTRFPSYY